MNNYLILWNPVNEWPTTVDAMRVVGSFATEGGLGEARKFMYRNCKDYAQEVNGHLRVVKTNGAEFLVEAA